MKYEFIQPYAVELCTILQPYCKIIKIGGSIRRKMPECKDIEIICIPDKFYLETELNALKRSGQIMYEKNGGAYKKFRWKSQSIDLFIAKPDNFGWIYFLRTGSAEFNQRYLNSYRRYNKLPIDVKASLGGYLRAADFSKVFTPDEKDVFDLAGWNFIEPENRVN